MSKYYPNLTVALALMCGCLSVSSAEAQLTANNDIVLVLDVTSGATRIENRSSSPIEINAYQITSTAGTPTASLLNDSGWVPLDTAPTLIGSQDDGDWDVLAGTTAQQLVEANPTSSLSLGVEASQNLGDVFTTDTNTINAIQNDRGGLGNSYLTGFVDFTFVDQSLGQQFSGSVEYENVLLNELVLEVNTRTGIVSFKNESTIDATIDFIQILSDGGNGSSLDPAGFVGLDGVPGLSGDWQFSPGANSAGAIQEFFPGDGSSSDEGQTFSGRTNASPTLASFSLGSIFDQGADENLSVNFRLVGSGNTTFAGVVRYVEDVIGDYNSDGFVDAADYTVWRDSVGGDGSLLPNRDPANTGIVSQDDYTSWQTNYGAAAGEAAAVAVPEPTTIVFACIGGLAIVGVTGRKRAA